MAGLVPASLGLLTAKPKDVDARHKAGHDVGMFGGVRVKPQLSKNDRNFLDLDGCFSLRSALASIWRMRSRVTENCWPTSSSVWSVFMPMPKRMRSTRSSLGVSEASTRVVVSRKLDWIAASIGRMAFLSSMKSPRCESSSSPLGLAKDLSLIH